MNDIKRKYSHNILCEDDGGYYAEYKDLIGCITFPATFDEIKMYLGFL